MPRCNNWPTALIEFILSRQNEPFAWGKNDCCLFGADWLVVLLGYDTAQAYRGAYDSALGAARVLEQHGGIESIVDTHFPRHPTIAYTRRGDLVAYLSPEGLTLGVCEGRDAVFAGHLGSMRVATLKCQTGWRID